MHGSFNHSVASNECPAQSIPSCALNKLFVLQPEAVGFAVTRQKLLVQFMAGFFVGSRFILQGWHSLEYGLAAEAGLAAEEVHLAQWMLLSSQRPFVADNGHIV